MSFLRPLWSESDTSCDKDERREEATRVLPAQTHRKRAKKAEFSDKNN